MSFQSLVLCATQLQKSYCNAIQLCHGFHTVQSTRDRHNHGTPPYERRPNTGQRCTDRPAISRKRSSKAGRRRTWAFCCSLFFNTAICHQFLFLEWCKRKHRQPFPFLFPCPFFLSRFRFRFRFPFRFRFRFRSSFRFVSVCVPFAFADVYLKYFANKIFQSGKVEEQKEFHQRLQFQKDEPVRQVQENIGNLMFVFVNHIESRTRNLPAATTGNTSAHRSWQQGPLECEVGIKFSDGVPKTNAQATRPHIDHARRNT